MRRPEKGVRLDEEWQPAPRKMGRNDEDEKIRRCLWPHKDRPTNCECRRVSGLARGPIIVKVMLGVEQKRTKMSLCQNGQFSGRVCSPGCNPRVSELGIRSSQEVKRQIICSNAPFLAMIKQQKNEK